MLPARRPMLLGSEAQREASRITSPDLRNHLTHPLQGNAWRQKFQEKICGPSPVGLCLDGAVWSQSCETVSGWCCVLSSHTRTCRVHFSTLHQGSLGRAASSFTGLRRSSLSDITAEQHQASLGRGVPLSL